MSRSVPVKSVRKSFDEIIFEEGLHGIYSFGSYNGNIISTTTQAVQVNIIPNYNPILQTAIRARTKINWSFDNPVQIVGGARDFFGANDPFTSGGTSLAGTQEIECDLNYPLQSVSFFASPVAPAVGKIWGTTSYTMMTNDLDFEAESTMVWVGDSVSAGTVNADLLKEQFYQHLVKKFIRDQTGFRLRLATYAKGGTQTNSMVTMLNNNHVRSSSPKFIFVQYGINDQSQSLGTTLYKSNLNRLFLWKKYKHPDAILVCLDATPVEGNTRETALDAYRSAMSEVVAASADSKIKYISMKDCYDRTLGSAIWATSDGAGSDRLHPGTALAHTGMANRITSRLVALGIV